MSNSAQGFSGQFIRNAGQIAWTGTTGDYQFQSAPLSTSSISFAEIGRETSGVFL